MISALGCPDGAVSRRLPWPSRRPSRPWHPLHRCLLGSAVRAGRVVSAFTVTPPPVIRSQARERPHLAGVSMPPSGPAPIDPVSAHRAPACPRHSCRNTVDTVVLRAWQCRLGHSSGRARARRRRRLVGTRFPSGTSGAGSSGGRDYGGASRRLYGHPGRGQTRNLQPGRRGRRYVGLREDARQAPPGVCAVMPYVLQYCIRSRCRRHRGHASHQAEASRHRRSGWRTLSFRPHIPARSSGGVDRGARGERGHPPPLPGRRACSPDRRI